MSEDAEDAITAVATAIRHYFELHPDAADSVVGIQHWWLPTQLLDAPLPLIELALERLVDEGGIRRTVHGDGTVIYASARRDQASEHGDERQDPPGGES